jgi:diguanylate cyclase (GGDEF)-like protein
MAWLGRRADALQVVAIDIAIVVMLGLMSRGGDAIDLFHIAFLLLVVEAFLVASMGFWARFALLLCAVEVLIVREGAPAWQDLAEPGVLATIAVLVFLMHRARDRARATLAEQATHDPLTGLLNRRALQQHLDDAVKRLHRDQRSFAVVYVDLDGFKAVNDELGHDAGDQVLIEIATRILEASNTDDVVGRIGGDEFALLLAHGDSPEIAEAAAQRMLTAIELPCSNGASLSASIGIAMATPSIASTTQALLAEADRAMYSVKRADKGAYAFSA